MPIHLTVQDKDTGKEVVYQSRIAYNEEMIGRLSKQMVNLGIILSDGEKDPDVTDINVKVVVSRERNTASIIKVIPDTTAVRPGRR